MFLVCCVTKTKPPQQEDMISRMRTDSEEMRDLEDEILKETGHYDENDDDYHRHRHHHGDDYFDDDDDDDNDDNTHAASSRGVIASLSSRGSHNSLLRGISSNNLKGENADEKHTTQPRRSKSNKSKGQSSSRDNRHGQNQNQNQSRRQHQRKQKRRFVLNDDDDSDSASASDSDAEDTIPIRQRTQSGNRQQQHDYHQQTTHSNSSRQKSPQSDWRSSAAVQRTDDQYGHPHHHHNSSNNSNNNNNNNSSSNNNNNNPKDLDGDGDDGMMMEDVDDFDLDFDDAEDPSKGNNKPVPGKPIDQATCIALRQIVFGSATRSRGFPPSWLRQGFVFNSADDRPTQQFGLVQYEGGPCGPIAAVQAHVLQHLLPNTRLQSGIGKRLKTDESNWGSVRDTNVLGDVLVEAFTTILVRAGADYGAGGALSCVCLPVCPFAAATAAYVSVCLSVFVCVYLQYDPVFVVFTVDGSFSLICSLSCSLCPNAGVCGVKFQSPSFRPAQPASIAPPTSTGALQWQWLRCPGSPTKILCPIKRPTSATASQSQSCCTASTRSTNSGSFWALDEPLPSSLTRKASAWRSSPTLPS